MANLVTSGFLTLVALSALASLNSALFATAEDNTDKLCKNKYCGYRETCRVIYLCEDTHYGKECVIKAKCLPTYKVKDPGVCKVGKPLVGYVTGGNLKCDDSYPCPKGYWCTPNDEYSGVCCLETPTCPAPTQKKYKTRKGYYYCPRNRCKSDKQCPEHQLCCRIYTDSSYCKVCVDAQKKTTTTTTTTETPTTTTTTEPTTTTTEPTTTTTEPTTTTTEPTTTTTEPTTTTTEPTTTTTEPTTTTTEPTTTTTEPTTTTTESPTTTTTPVETTTHKINEHCPANSRRVKCGKYKCSNDDDCRKGFGCCDSKRCNKSGKGGTACVKLPKKKPVFDLDPFKYFKSYYH